MRYLWDTDKARKNELKHDITFEEATELLSQSDVVDIPVKSKGEKRYLAIARMRGEYLPVINTIRNGARRIISARHSTKKERAVYERDHYRGA